MTESDRASNLLRFVGREMGALSFDKIKELEELIAEYVTVEGREAGMGVNLSQGDAAQNLEAWDSTLKTHEKISKVIYNLENYFLLQSNELQKIQEIFDLKMVNAFLTAVVMKGSTMFREMEEKKKIKLNVEKLKDNNIKEEYISLIQKYIESSPQSVNSDLGESIEIKIPEEKKEREQYFKKGNIVIWELVYLTALIEKQKEENIPEYEVNKNRAKIQSAVKDFLIQYSKEKGYDRESR